MIARRVLTLGALGTLLLAGGTVGKDYGPGTVVGQVTRTTGQPISRKVFIQAGSQKWALHMNRTTKVFHAGKQISVHNLDLGTWVRARGRRIGRLRLEVARLDVAGDRAAYRRSDSYRPSAPDGYFVAR